MAYLKADFFLLFSGKVDKVIVLGADEEGDGSLVETSALSVPFLDGVESALTREIEHEENGDGVVADKGEHVDKFALSTQVPDGEGDFGVPDGDCFLHEVDAYLLHQHRPAVKEPRSLGINRFHTQSLDVVLVPAALYILDH